jgi:8-oxo-dGTP pyrophosphatase MutT (NUDIX family)
VSLVLVNLGSILPNEEHVDAAVRELHEETGLVLTPDDLTLLSDAHVRVTLPQGRQLVYVYSATIHVMFATNNLRTPAQVEQVVIAQSTINPPRTYMVYRYEKFLKNNNVSLSSGSGLSNTNATKPCRSSHRGCPPR